MEHQHKIDVTIVTPFYKGNQYMCKLFECVRNNAKSAPNINIEFLLVNDSPECDIVYQKEWVENFNLKIIKNEKNVGIHQSRANGIVHALGKYILMLDQDDLLSDDAIASQLENIKDGDIVVANGRDENPYNCGNIYRTLEHQKLVLDVFYYYLVGNMIVSPGQCLIKKDKIPKLWLTSYVKENGSDDLLLWLFMMNSDIKWTINDQCVYVHSYTGENVSMNLEKMTQSSLEVLHILKQYHLVSPKHERLFKRRFKMRRIYEGKGFIERCIATILYPDIAFMLFKMKRI